MGCGLLVSGRGTNELSHSALVSEGKKGKNMLIEGLDTIGIMRPVFCND